MVELLRKEMRSRQAGVLVHHEGAVRRFASIRKSRLSRCDLRLRELVLTDAGLVLAGEGPPIDA